MTDLRKAAEMALEALESVVLKERYGANENGDAVVKFCALIKAADATATLRQALAQEQEPVSWNCPINDKNCKTNCGSYGCGN